MNETRLNTTWNVLRRRPGPDRNEIRAALAGIAVVLLVVWSGLAEGLDLHLLDAKLRLLDRMRESGGLAGLGGPRAPSNELVLVEFEDSTMMKLGLAPPLPRLKLAEVIDRITAAGARTVALAFHLPTRDQNTPEDAILKAAIERSGRVIFSMQRIRDGNKVGMVGNDPYFVEAMVREAGILGYLDADGKAREYRYAKPKDRAFLPSLALGIMLASRNIPDSAVELTPSKLRISYGSEPAHELVLDGAYGGQLLDMTGSGAPFARHEWLQLLEILDKDPQFLKDKVVLVGSTALSTNDFPLVPVSPSGQKSVPSLYLHAFALHQLLEGCFLRRATVSENRRFAAAVLVLALIGLFLVPGTAAFAFALFAAGATLTAGAIHFVATGVDVALSFPIGLALVPALAVGLVRARRHMEPRAIPTDAQDPLGLPTATLELLCTRYAEFELLGRGGMGRVISALDEKTGTRVAIKIPDLSGARQGEVRRRFQREMSSLAALDHPNIVKVVDMHLEEPMYYAMQLVHGETLRARIERDGALSPAAAISVMRPIAAALAHSHARGMLHRDLKPENILLTREGKPLLTDFGLVYLDTETRLTRDCSMLGTPTYLSPEAINGEEPTVLMDVYSFGVVLFELLRGEPPFLAAKIHQRMVQEAPRLELSGTRPGPELSTLVARCLGREPHQRPQSFDEVVQALEGL